MTQSAKPAPGTPAPEATDDIDPDTRPLEPHEYDAYARDLALHVLKLGVEAGIPSDKMAMTMLMVGFLSISELTSPVAAAALAEMFADSLRRGELRLPKTPAPR